MMVAEKQLEYSGIMIDIDIPLKAPNFNYEHHSGKLHNWQYHLRY
jgi:hypothetical protein